MFNNRLLKALTVVVMLVELMIGLGYLAATTAMTVEAAAPQCNVFTVNTSGLTASEIYYAQLAAERFMVQSCSIQPPSNLSVSEASVIPVIGASLSASEVYYAQKAKRFMPSEIEKGIADLPQ